MTQQEYNNLLTIAYRLSKGDHRTEDLVHDILTNFLSTPVYKTLPKKERVFYFIRAFRNQYEGSSSYFKRDYKKYDYGRMDITIDPIEEEREETPSMEFVYQCLEELNWYERDLFHLYIKEGTIAKLHKKTNIPLYSLRKSIKTSKQYIREKWFFYIQNN